MKKTVLPFQSRYKAYEKQDSRAVPVSATELLLGKAFFVLLVVCEDKELVIFFAFAGVMNPGFFSALIFCRENCGKGGLIICGGLALCGACLSDL